MTDFVLDGFVEGGSDVDLDLHSPDTGGAWTKQTSGGNALTVIAANNHVTGPAAGGGYFNAASPGGADYAASVVYKASGSGLEVCYPAVRCDTGGADTFYYAYVNGANNIHVAKIVGGSYSNLPGGYGYSNPMSTTVPATLKLDISGTTLKTYVDGVLQVTCTDGSITAAGAAGFGCADGCVVESFLAENSATGGSVVLSPVTGSISVSGQAASAVAVQQALVSTGNAVVLGQSVSAAGGVTIIPAAGLMSVTGLSVTATATDIAAILVGVTAVTGLPVTAVSSTIISAITGSISVSGGTLTAVSKALQIITAGQITISGLNVSLAGELLRILSGARSVIRPGIIRPILGRFKSL